METSWPPIMSTRYSSVVAQQKQEDIVGIGGCFILKCEVNE